MYPWRSPIITLGYPLDQLLMILLLSEGKGLLHHGCGIEDRGLGYLFVGNSGHGKSTMAKVVVCAKAPRVLNDDRVVVRLEKRKLLDVRHALARRFQGVLNKRLPISKDSSYTPIKKTG